MLRSCLRHYLVFLFHGLFVLVIAAIGSLQVVRVLLCGEIIYDSLAPEYTIERRIIFFKIQNVHMLEPFSITGRSLKDVVNSLSQVTHKLNAGVPQGSLIVTTLILQYIDGLFKSILRSLGCIYADNTTVYRSISKTLKGK